MEAPAVRISTVDTAPLVRSRLELLDERRFGNGVVHLRHRVTT
jgi:hypothetical protein